MPLVVTPSLETVYTKLRAFLIDVLPVNVPVIRGLGNRASMPPPSPGFVAMTATLDHPHRTPQAAWDLDNPNPTEVAYEQGMSVRIQLDCYGAASADWAAQLATLLRTDYACVALAPEVAPLFANDPLQAALINAEAQYEERWIVGANLQYNPVTSTPAQFMDTAEVGIINVDERFPP